MITHLLIKPVHKQPLVAVDVMQVSEQGIAHNVACSPLRQVLLLEQQTLGKFNLQPGDLRENVIVDKLDLYGLPSGTVLQIGAARIALTFHCEPCKIIADKVNLKNIRDERGYLGRFLNTGAIHVGDTVTITDTRMDSVPESPTDRIAWYLAQIDTPILASDLMWQVGLASSYCRALPAMIQKHPDIDSRKILFKNSIL